MKQASVLAIAFSLVLVTSAAATQQFFPKGSFDPADGNYLGNTTGYATLGDGFTINGGFTEFSSPLEGSETHAEFQVSDLNNGAIPSEFTFLNGSVDDGGQSGTTVDSFSIDFKASGEIQGVDGKQQGIIVALYGNTPFEVVAPGTDPVPLTIDITLDASGFMTGGGSASQGFDAHLVELPDGGTPSVMTSATGFYGTDGTDISFSGFQVNGQPMNNIFSIVPQVSVNEQAEINFSYTMDVNVTPGQTYAMTTLADLAVDTNGISFSHLNSSNTFSVSISSPDSTVQFALTAPVPEPAAGLLLAAGATVLASMRRGLLG